MKRLIKFIGSFFSPGGGKVPLPQGGYVPPSPALQPPPLRVVPWDEGMTSEEDREDLIRSAFDLGFLCSREGFNADVAIENYCPTWEEAFIGIADKEKELEKFQGYLSLREDAVRMLTED